MSMYTGLYFSILHQWIEQEHMAHDRQGLRASSVPLTKAEWYHQLQYVFKERRVVQFVVLGTQMEDEDE